MNLLGELPPQPATREVEWECPTCHVRSKVYEGSTGARCLEHRDAPMFLVAIRKLTLVPTETSEQ